jgi:pimeloyl-ACP methyl ester carboxylesterase
MRFKRVRVVRLFIGVFRCSFVQNRILISGVDGLESLANSIPAAATGRFAKPLHHAFIRSLILGTSVEGYISLCGVIAEANVPDYACIQVPLLIVAGQDDKTAPLSGCNEILKAYGTSEKKKSIKVVDGVGHWHCVENPDSIAQKVRFFIDQYRKDVSTV